MIFLTPAIILTSVCLKLLCLQTLTFLPDFSNPKFQSVTFRTGKFAAVRAMRFFKNTPLAWADSDWRGALGSKYGAKELMQTSPDTAQMYEKGDDWKDHARYMFFADQVRLLHDLHICQFFEHETIEAGQILSWDSIYHNATKGKKSESKSEEIPNHHVLNDFSGDVFIYETNIFSAWVQQFDLARTKFILSPASWLKFVRCFLLELSNRLEVLIKRIKEWQTDHPLPKDYKTEDGETNVKSRRYDAMITLESMCMEERLAIQKSLRLVPPYDLLEEVSTAVRKTTADEKEEKSDNEGSISKGTVNRTLYGTLKSTKSLLNIRS
jgi:hypothetical protein